MRRRFTSNSFWEFDYSNYLTIEALEDGLQVTFSSGIEFHFKTGGWKTLPKYAMSPSINAGETISFRGNLTPSVDGIGTFTISKKCNLKGNCMSMLFGDNVVNNYSLSDKKGAFYRLFRGCTNIVNVSENFLPATTLAESCYEYMFYGCTSLTTAPTLPATTLEKSCYRVMFHGCTKLNYIKMLATDISASYCLDNWVRNIASTGTFVKNPEATWEVYGDNGIPNGWKVVMDGEESNLKSFQINNIGDVEEFYFEDGMTWGEWVDSEYNNGDYGVDEFDGSIYKLEFGMPVGWIGDDYGYILSSDIILEATYYLTY